VALLLLAGLQVIPGDLYEAAEVDGAGVLQQFRKITLPLLMPAILVTLIFRTLDALRVFDVFYVFFGNRPDTQTMAIYGQSTIVGDGHVGYGAAISVAIFLIIAIFVVIYLTLNRVAAEE
jgi:trehalose/maltose transport system permease protein